MSTSESLSSNSAFSGLEKVYTRSEREMVKEGDGGEMVHGSRRIVRRNAREEIKIEGERDGRREIGEID